ncbi:MAG: phosphoribosylformylglycinamidine cyclo-ligase [Anaerolineales bacterium]|nr:phosphoribosylformylglycinamidine cyclo-ligase [Anaerolineales bacterium]
MDSQKSDFIKTEHDDLTYKVNGLAMQVHNELKPGHAEKFYQRRLRDLCLAIGLAAEIEKRVDVWIEDKKIGYLILDLWIEESLVVECKAFSHHLSADEAGQVMTYLTATGTPVGLLYNFGRKSLEFKRIFPSKDVQDWQKFLYRSIHVIPGMTLPPLPEPRGKDNQPSIPIPPIRFNVGKSATVVNIPSPSGAAVRASIKRAENFSKEKEEIKSASSIRYPLPKSDYASSGVDIDAGNRAVELMKDSVKATYNESVLAGIGSFGGLFDASALKQMDNPVLVASTDGVGTKVKLAASVGRYRGIGHDIVNHCINDILVQGARPLFFMDYFATSKLNPEQTADVVTGIAEACKESGMALLGGETAEMPGVYRDGEFDVAGTIVGVLERSRLLPRPNLLAGDLILGLPSSGPHTNGYSLIRKVFEGADLESVHPELGCSLADALLAPHRSYFNALYPYLDKVKALAHLTGGGFIENIPRVLPENLSAVIHLNAWQVPPLWKLIQQQGNISTEEMYRVFNMGIGMVTIVDKAIVNDLQSSIPEPTFIIGELVDGEQKTILA